MNHTPGPWHISGDAIYSGTPDPKGGYSNSQQVLPFYDCDPTGIHGRRHAADARLIAAAPELLEALQAIARGLTNGQKERGETFQSIARAAIAKATT